MANAYDALLAQFYTPADRRQSFFDSLGPLGAGLIAAGAPSTNPAAFSQGVSQGLLGMQQTMRQGEQDALRRGAISSQMATAGLQQQKLQQEMAARQNIARIMEGLFPGATPPAGPAMPGASPPALPAVGTSTPGPISGPPASAGASPVPARPPAPAAPVAPSGAPSGGATGGRSLTEQAAALSQLAAAVMPFDVAQGTQILRLAREYDPNVKVEMTAAGELLIRGPDGRFFSAPGVDAAKARRAGLIAGSEAGARNASELRFAGPIAAAREQGKNQGAVSLVTVPGVGPLPGTQAVAQTTEAGKAVGAMTPVASPWGTMPAPQAMETARSFAGRDVDVSQPGTRIVRVPPDMGAAPQAAPRVETTDSGFGMVLPPAAGAQARPQAAAPGVIAQSDIPHPQSRGGMDMKARSELSAKESEATLEKAKSSSTALRTLQAMRDQVSSGFTPGPAAPMRATASAWLQELGVRQNLADSITRGQTGFFRLAETQTLQLVQDIAKTFGANPSNYEGQQLAKAVAQTTDPKEAYLAIVDYAMEQHRRNVEGWLAQENARAGGNDAVTTRTQGMQQQMRDQDPLGLLGGRR